MVSMLRYFARNAAERCLCVDELGMKRPVGGGSSVWVGAGAVREAALEVVRTATPELALKCMHKLRPLLRPSSGVFTAEAVEELVMRLQSACAHDCAAAQLPPGQEAALRQDLLTACVLLSAPE